MRIDENYEERRKEELREEFKTKVTATLVAAALAVTPAAIVYKIEQDKMETMMEYYEILLEETNQNSYLQGYLDALFGTQDNNILPIDDQIGNEIIETKELILEIPKEMTVKKLAYVKKNTKY